MTRLLPLCIALAAAVVVVAQAPLAIRLDDVQCGYKQVETMALIDAFLRHQVPLTLGLITAPPLNYQGNYDCHIADLLTRKAQFAAAGVGLEFASHSITHDVLTSMTPDQQFVQLNSSKVHIEQMLGVQVSTFFPPTNQWNTDTMAQMVNAGYTIVSDQCGAGQMNAAGPDTSCIVNNRRDIAKPYFAAIDGIVHVSVGAQAADVLTGVHLSPAQIMEESSNCATTYCTINSQVVNVAQYTEPAVGWGVFMVHGFEFANTSDIDAWADALLPMIKAKYTTYTIKGLAEAISGNNLTPNLTSSTGVSSRSSSSTGGTGSTTGAATTTGASTGIGRTFSSTATIRTSSSSTGANGAASIAPSNVLATAIFVALVAAINSKL